MIYQPRIYQPWITNFILDHRRCNVFARMGAGKGPATLEAIATLKLFGEAKRVLVIAPKLVAQSTWSEEREKFFESFGHMTIAAAVGTKEQRRRAVMSKPDILTINYESFQWLSDGYGGDLPFDMVVADESARLKGLRIGVRTSCKGKEYIQGQGSSRAKAIADIAFKRVRRWVSLNGSPAPNGIVDLFGQMYVIDGGKRLGTSFAAFEQRWFTTFKTPDGYTSWVPLPGAKEEIENLIRDVSITIDPRPYLNVREQTEHIVYVDLKGRARQQYDEMERDLFTEIRNGQINLEVEAFNSGSKTNKCLQLANGAVYHNTETKEWEETHDLKIEALKSVVSEANGENLLVRYCFKPDMARILKAFPRARTVTPETLKDFKAGRLPMLVAHAASIGHGHSLQDHCRTLVDFSSHFNLGEDEQIIERVGATRQAQSGLNRDVFRYRIVARDTVEEHSVLPRLREKLSVQESLLRAMMRRG